LLKLLTVRRRGGCDFIGLWQPREGSGILDGMLAQRREEEFRRELEPLRRAITVHCYRMLGSLDDAEEVVQESMLKAWQRLPEVRSSGSRKAWLYKVATNACLDFLKSRRRRTLPHLVDTPVTEGPWLEPLPDAMLDVADDEQRGPEARRSMRESVSLAFVAAIQSLTPKQRAALLLVDVLGWTPRETAELLETNVVSVNSLLQRARNGVEGRAPGAMAPLRDSITDQELLRRYIASWETGDLDAFTALLADDAILSMPPEPEWYAGRDAIRRFLGTVLPAWVGQYRLLPLRANGSLAVAVYRQRAIGQPHEATAITLVSARQGRIAQMIRFASPKLFPRFGLPDRLPISSSPAT
jgi:RNA polymerase sigma-70 factor (ECF subfamily)